MWYKNEIRRYLNRISDFKSLRMIYTVAKCCYENLNDEQPTTNDRDRLDEVLDVLAPEDIRYLLTYICEFYEIQKPGTDEETDAEPGANILLGGKVIC